jgi:transcriptional/translational regulatory protein YebC/TACO1
MEHVIESGADDYEFKDGVIEVYTEPNMAGQVGDSLSKHGYNILSAQNEQVPSTYTTLDETDEIQGEQSKKMSALLEMLEDNDDVQDVWHNAKQEQSE